MKNNLKKIYRVLSSQFGIDPRRMLNSICSFPRFLRDYYRFKSNYTGALEIRPCLLDWFEESGSTEDDYFWQDLYVARKIFAAAPDKHVDIGSRVDGFVAHVASFREIEVFDIRPITAKVPGVTFRQVDLMNPVNLSNYCDSLSCLHALEHFGLGRYGDPIDPKGYESGIHNMAQILRDGGVLYLSVPIGSERVVFNAHHVFDPLTILKIVGENRLVLREFTFFSEERGLIELEPTRENLAMLGKKHYNLGIFTFLKGKSR
ncbi:MAG: DUF268 domain-containing protein [Candidatus Wallbacteria bacterium]|nr:DUF268 domain-containing protein [Candidatus Wallbacteria bacterium]